MRMNVGTPDNESIPFGGTTSVNEEAPTYMGLDFLRLTTRLSLAL